MNHEEPINKDYFFIFLAAVLGVISIIDAGLTYLGLDVGFQEGNPLMHWAMMTIGKTPTLIINVVATIGIVALIIIVRHRMKTEKEIRLIYTALALTIAWRAFIIGAWIGVLGSL